MSPSVPLSVIPDSAPLGKITDALPGHEEHANRRIKGPGARPREMDRKGRGERGLE